jgi:small subunit ribosomal protein S1
MYRAGEIVEGQVTKLVPFGAFVRVAQGIEGLVHISELTDQHVETPEAVLAVGETVRVKVIDVDVSRRRISLSMRQVGAGAVTPPVEHEIEAEVPASEEEIRAVSAPVDFSEVEEAVQAAGEPAAPPEEEEEEEGGLEAPAAPPTPEPTPEGPESEPAAAKEEEEDVSLEAILEDLKRREGRAE